jgi:hypothetical protein
VGLGLYPNVPCGENMRTCQGVDLDITHYGELTLVFLEGVASRSPHGSAMCDKHSLDHTPL